MRSVVVLPEPDGPSRAKNSPSPTSRSMPSTAWTSPNVLRTDFRETAGAAWDVASGGCDKRLLQPVEAGVEVGLAHVDGHKDAENVVIDPGLEQEQPALERSG